MKEKEGKNLILWHPLGGSSCHHFTAVAAAKPMESGWVDLGPSSIVFLQ